MQSFHSAASPACRKSRFRAEMVTTTSNASAGSPPLRRRVGQQRNHSHHPNKRSGPAVREYKRHGSGTLAPLMDEMSPATLPIEPEMLKRRKPLHLRLPIKLVAPVGAKYLFKNWQSNPYSPFIWSAIAPAASVPIGYGGLQTANCEKGKSNRFTAIVSSSNDVFRHYVDEFHVTGALPGGIVAPIKCGSFSHSLVS